MARTVGNSKPIANPRWEIIDWQVDQPWEIVPPTHVPNFSTCKPRKFGSVILVSVTPITYFKMLSWLAIPISYPTRIILFIRICVGVIEENKVYKDSYRRLGILRYIFENIQDDSVRWYPSVTKTSRQISAHFLQHSSLWMNRSAQCELYNSCLYFFKVLLHYIVLCNFFLCLCQRVPLKKQLSEYALSFSQIQRWTF